MQCVRCDEDYIRSSCDASARRAKRGLESLKIGGRSRHGQLKSEPRVRALGRYRFRRHEAWLDRSEWILMIWRKTR